MRKIISLAAFVAVIAAAVSVYWFGVSAGTERGQQIIDAYVDPAVSSPEKTEFHRALRQFLREGTDDVLCHRRLFCDYQRLHQQFLKKFRSAPSRLKAACGPLGGSDDTQCGSVGATYNLRLPACAHAHTRMCAYSN